MSENLFKNASQDFIKANPNLYGNTSQTSLQRSQSKRYKAAALVFPIRGEKSSTIRIIVRFVGYRTRPLDPDNFAGGCKDLLDGLRHSALIPGDEAWRIKFETEQIKVAHRSEEKTEIVLIYPE